MAGTDGLGVLEFVGVEEADAALSDADRVHPASNAETSRNKPENFVIVSKDRDSVEISSGSTRHSSTIHRSSSGSSTETEVSRHEQKKRGKGN